MNKKLAAAVSAAVLLGAVALTGCDDHKQGPPGKVVAKDTDTTYHPKVGKYGHAWTEFDYFLTTQGKDGSVVRFEVSDGDYDDCYRGSSYPRCTER